MSADSLSAKLPTDVCSHINFFLTIIAQQTLVKYYKSYVLKNRLRLLGKLGKNYRVLYQNYIQHPSLGAAAYIANFCIDASTTWGGVWVYRAYNWNTRTNQHATIQAMNLNLSQLLPN